MLKGKDTWLVAAAVAVFAIWKLTNLHFRFGDEDVYFYMTHAISGGLMPYRDFFLADPPFFVFLLTPFKWIIGNHLILFKIWPVLFDSASAVLIFLLLKIKENRLAFMGPIFYLFSFTILSTSDYVTGAEVMIFCILLALYTYIKQKPVWSGVFWALACLCKLYAAPALIGFLLYKIYKRDWANLKKIILGGVIATFVMLIPFVIMAPHQLLYDLIIHQFNRPAGLNKWNVFSLFGQMEWFLIILGTIGAIITKSKSLSFQLLLSFIFLLWYKDLYYLYLQLIMPYLVLLSVETVEKLRVRSGNEVSGAVIALYCLSALYPIITYATVTAPDSIFNNPQAVATALKNTPDNLPIYGIQEVAPLTTLMAGKSIFNNIIDTNTQNFTAHTHDRTKISKEAVQNGIYLITRGPSDLYFDPSLFKQYCKHYSSFEDSVEIYKCIN